MFAGCKVHIIDFGFACSYLNKEGQHLDQLQTENFYGNLFYSSLNQLNFNSQSRRDDLISLSYMISSLLNEGKLNNLTSNDQKSQVECFHAVLKAKQDMTIKEMCGKYHKSIYLRSFFEHVFSLNFKEKPDYERLQHLLQKFAEEDFNENCQSERVP